MTDSAPEASPTANLINVTARFSASTSHSTRRMEVEREETERWFMSKGADILPATGKRVARLSPRVSTPADLQRRIELGDFFLREITCKGRTLYERPRSRGD